jgi:hypothetical protein
MPKYTNQFISPGYVEHTVGNPDGSVRGKLRLKPSSVLWKPAGSHTFWAVPLSEFEDWISSSQRSKRVKQ